VKGLGNRTGYIPSPEDGNRPSFGKVVVFFGRAKDRQNAENKQSYM
jgi:hypothetical protein